MQNDEYYEEEVVEIYKSRALADEARSERDKQRLKAWGLGALIVGLAKVGEFTSDFFLEED